MKRSLKLFNKKGKKPRRNEDFIDFDEEFDEEFEEEYDEDDYPDEEFEEQYGDDRYESDRDYRDDEDYDSEVDGRDYRDDDYEGPEYDELEEEEYEEADYHNGEDYDPEYDELEEKRYESDRDYRDDEEYEPKRGGKYPEEDFEPEDDRDYRDDKDYRSEDDREYRDDEDYDPEYDGEYPEDEEYPEEDYRDEEEYPEDEDYDPEYDEDYRDEDYDPEYDDYPEDDYPEDDREYRGGRGKKDKGRKNHGKSKNKGRDKKHDGEGAGAKIIKFVKDTSFAERAAAIIAVFLVVGGIFTMNFYSKALNRTKEINSFVEVGTNLAVSDVVGSSGLLAVADAERAKAIASHLIEEEEEEEVIADDAKGVTIQMTLTTIKSDMKIKFINSQSNKLVANVPFTVTVVTPDGTKVNYDDHDKDGIIYKKDLTAGTYKVTPNALSSEYDNYKLDTSTKSLTIKDTVEMKAVDVSNEIKKESQVNAAKEDTAVQTVVESELKDTVEWVQSNQNSSSGDGKYSYEAVDRSNVADPSFSSKVTVYDVRTLAGARARTTSEGGELDPGAGASTGASTEVPSDPSTGASIENPTEGSSQPTEGSSQSTEGSSQPSEGASTGGSTDTPQQDKTMTLASTSLTLKVGETGSVAASGPSSAEYTSSDACVTVSSDGTVKAVSEGTATITVKASGYKDATATVTVKAADVVKKDMALSTTSLTLKVGGSEKITVTGPSSPIFSVADSSKATVSGDGTVKGVAEGKTTITVKADGYNDATVSVTVSKAPLTLNTSTTLNLVMGDTTKITAKETTSLTFKCNNEAVVKVDKDGNVTTLNPGTATITVSAENYDSADIAVTVKAKSTEFKLNASKITLVQGKTFKIGATDSNLKPTYSSDKPDYVSVASDGTITGKAAGTATVTAKCDGYSDVKVEVTVVSNTTILKDKSGNTLYVKDSNGNYVEATYADYYNNVTLYLRRENSNNGTRYGWWTIDGKTYYYDKNGNKVTGEQVIQGAKYSFGSDGALSSSSGTLGIDVSKWNGNIDWNQVKRNGVNFVIIRCGYRGSSAGALIEDPKYKSNIQGATAAGLRVGLYFFSQAVNEVEAVEEASMCINLAKGYSMSFPIYIDVEGSNGRGDAISASQRTANIKAFCGTIQSAGYKAGVYSNKTWFTQNINTASLTNYKIWLAQYAASVTYTATRYDMWQYTSKGSVAGISGKVDMNILYN